jgi:hypothetical protein
MGFLFLLGPRYSRANLACSRANEQAAPGYWDWGVILILSRALGRYNTAVPQNVAQKRAAGVYRYSPKNNGYHPSTFNFAVDSALSISTRRTEEPPLFLSKPYVARCAL